MPRTKPSAKPESTKPSRPTPDTSLPDLPATQRGVSIAGVGASATDAEAAFDAHPPLPDFRPLLFQAEPAPRELHLALGSWAVAP